MNDQYTLERILSFFEENADVDSTKGMAKVGIKTSKVYGLRIPQLSQLAKKIGKNSELAKQLWEIDTRETRILACMIENPKTVTEKQIDSWVADFDYWEICDQCIMKLIEKTPFAHKKILDWIDADEEYVKRAGFVMIARLAVCDKKAPDEVFISNLQHTIKGAEDERHTVKIAVNWAIRQIGKRNTILNKEAIKIAKKIQKMESKTALWIAKDALKELESEAVQKRLA
jgi:3-methyladenine DNA glycosylase AlkD